MLDEAQAIKNPDSQAARAAYALHAPFRLALTGTPVENRLEELWSLMHFTNRGLLGGRRDFEDRYARPIAEGRAGAAAALRQRVRPFVLRRLKRDVAPELPPRTDAVLHVELGDGERAVYDAVRAATRSDVARRCSTRAGGVHRRRSRRCCGCARRPATRRWCPGRARATSSKVEALLEALETAVADGHKALVFSQWTSLLDLIEPPSHAPSCRSCASTAATRDRGRRRRRASRPPAGPPVMLISLKAGGTRPQPDRRRPRLPRATRGGTPPSRTRPPTAPTASARTRPVFVYRLVAAGTVEERILALQDSKRALIDAALGDGAAAAGLTKDDLLALLA